MGMFDTFNMIIKRFLIKSHMLNNINIQIGFGGMAKIKLTTFTKLLNYWNVYATNEIR